MSHHQSPAERAPDRPAHAGALSAWPCSLWVVHTAREGRGRPLLAALQKTDTAKLQPLRPMLPQAPVLHPWPMLHPGHPRCPQVHTFSQSPAGTLPAPDPIRLGPQHRGLTLHPWGVGLGLVRPLLWRLGLI